MAIMQFWFTNACNSSIIKGSSLLMGKDQNMKPLNITIDGLLHRRPGLSKIKFTAEYTTYKRRGTVVYDTVNQKFLSHGSDVEFLASICIALSNPNKIYR